MYIEKVDEWLPEDGGGRQEMDYKGHEKTLGEKMGSLSQLWGWFQGCTHISKFIQLYFQYVQFSVCQSNFNKAINIDIHRE